MAVRTRGARGVGSRRDASVERATGADHWDRAGAGACGARGEGARREGRVWEGWAAAWERFKRKSQCE